MISSLQLQDYRGFKDFTLSNLGRINLLVGMNNCGKTAVLEAVNLLASAGDPRVLTRIARQRAGGRERSRGPRRSTPPFWNHPAVPLCRSVAFFPRS